MHWGGQMKVSLIGCFGLRQLAGCCLPGLVDLVGLKEDYAAFVWMGSFCWVSADRRSDFQGVSRRLDSRWEAVWGITNREQKAAAPQTKKGQFVKWLQNNCCNRITKSNELALALDFIFFPHFLLKMKTAWLSKRNSSLLSSHPFASESFWKHTQGMGETFPPVSWNHRLSSAAANSKHRLRLRRRRSSDHPRGSADADSNFCVFSSSCAAASTAADSLTWRETHAPAVSASSPWKCPASGRRGGGTLERRRSGEIDWTQIKLPEWRPGLNVQMRTLAHKTPPKSFNRLLAVCVHVCVSVCVCCCLVLTQPEPTSTRLGSPRPDLRRFCVNFRPPFFFLVCWIFHGCHKSGESLNCVTPETWSPACRFQPTPTDDET